MFFKSVAELCFTGPFAVLGKAKQSTNKAKYKQTNGRTDGR